MGKAIGLFVAGLAGVVLLYYWLFAYSPAWAILVVSTAVIYLIAQYIIWFIRKVRQTRSDTVRELDDKGS